MVESNHILYEKGEKPDHCVVIKYVPYVGDSKRALDEYTSEIFMHGLNTIVLHNTCEVCLLSVVQAKKYTYIWDGRVYFLKKKKNSCWLKLILNTSTKLIENW